ncbi:MAG: hypothetical protein ACLP0H_11000 [Terriglobales bacterium]
MYVVEGSLKPGDIDVLGDGINMAQRVMDCGDACHILVSGIAANFLSHVGRWSDLLHDLGEAASSPSAISTANWIHCLGVSAFD